MTGYDGLYPTRNIRCEMGEGGGEPEARDRCADGEARQAVGWI